MPQIIKGDFVKTLRIATAKESFEDWPWPLVYEKVDEAFPNSRFVLTTRDPARWLASYRAMLAAQLTPSSELIAIRCNLFGMDPMIASDGDLIERVQTHNKEVLKYFQSRPSQLLVVNWEAGDSWGELCNFLGLPIPDEPFPHMNRRA